MNTLFKYFQRLLPAFGFGLLMLCFPVLEGCRKTERICIDAPAIIIEEQAGEGADDSLYTTNTAVSGNIVVFSANRNYDSYSWKVGTDARIWDKPTVRLSFPKGENITIRLIGKRAPDPECIPGDDGVDTLFQTLTIIEAGTQPLIGEWEGSTDDQPTLIFKVKIVKTADYASYEIYNLRRNCSTQQGNVVKADNFGYRIGEFFGEWDDPCEGPRGYLYVKENPDELFIDYVVPKSTVSGIVYMKRKFTGKRKQ